MDLLRVVSIAFVVLGHWLAAVVLVQGGALVVGRIHALVPWTQWTTWVFQVMPVFFLVGGAVNARSWARASAEGGSWSEWMQRRAQRLLRPLVPLFVFWAALVPLLLVIGLPRDYVHLASRFAFVPIWFLGVYIVVIALVPLTWLLHRRFGWWVVFAFFVAAALVDALVRRDVPFAGYANLVFVWAGIHQTGYFWHDERLPRHPVAALAWAALALSALVALVTLGGYPVSMVVVEAGARSNASPPTIALFALGLTQLGIAAAARASVSHWLERPRVWAAVVLVGSVAFTVFLWHMTAMLLAAVVAHVAAPGMLTSAVDARWWSLRPLWILSCAVLLAGLVAVFQRFDRRGPRAASAPPARTIVGLLATLAGIIWLVRKGLYDPGSHWPIAAAAIASLAVGLGSLGALSPRRAQREPRARLGKGRSRPG